MKILKFLLALIIAGIVIIPPAYFLNSVFKPITLHDYEKDLQMIYEEGVWKILHGCSYAFPFQSGSYVYIANCVDKSKKDADNNLNEVSLGDSFNIPKSFLSELLRVPDTPLEQEICFKSDPHFKGFPEKKITAETRVFLYPKPVQELSHVHVDKMTVLAFNKAKCISAQSGMTLIAIGQGEVQVDKKLIDGINTTAKFTIPLLTQSGDSIFLGEEQVSQINENAPDGKKVTLIESSIKPLIFEFTLVNNLHIYSRLSYIQKLILIITVFSVWLIVIQSFIKSCKDLLSSFWTSAKEAYVELFVWCVKQKNNLSALRKASKEADPPEVKNAP